MLVSHWLAETVFSSSRTGDLRLSSMLNNGLWKILYSTNLRQIQYASSPVFIGRSFHIFNKVISADLKEISCTIDGKIYLNTGLQWLSTHWVLFYYNFNLIWWFNLLCQYLLWTCKVETALMILEHLKGSSSYLLFEDDKNPAWCFTILGNTDARTATD